MWERKESIAGREKKESVKIGDFFCSQLLAELNFHYSAEQNPPFKNPRSATGKHCSNIEITLIFSAAHVVQQSGSSCLTNNEDQSEYAHNKAILYLALQTFFDVCNKQPQVTN